MTTRTTSSRRPPRARPSWGARSRNWSIRKLADYLERNTVRQVKIGRERLRRILRERGISFQRTRTWKESKDPDKDTKLDRIEEVTARFPDRCFAFDQFGPLSIRPCHGTCWAQEGKPDRLRATYHRTHGVRYFHGCHSIGDDLLWGVNRHRKGGANTLAALKTIRAARPDGAPIYVILDNLSANKTPAIRAWARKNNVELCLTPTSASWANPIEARRARLVTEATACVQQLTDLLECVWPAVLTTAAKQWKSATWRACPAVVLERCGGDPARLRRPGRDRFVAAVRRELPAGAAPPGSTPPSPTGRSWP